ncbi:exopolygalacturonase-like [Tripterygium wilfordii]|uniref:exopolygalacturonase-like n=1 Tax=Tripterygium wilfordii TaxID=458696 RepID=UPI0018F7FC72|nr:exopolygalacturonase-like [Tripterygium wilfordii]
MGLGRICLVWCILVVTVTCNISGPPQVFDVRNYGAISDGETDNQEAFLKAWNDACKWEGRARLLIPPGTYMVEPIIFSGQCNGSMTVVLKGVLKAPTNPSSFINMDHWITFRYVDWLTVTGGGTLDGQGASAWPYNNCNKNSNCPKLPITMRLDFITNGMLKHIKSVNSKNAHFNLFACNNTKVSHVKITAPGDSPNTDGIKIGGSNNIEISHTGITTGDDCIAILGGGTSGVNITDVFCGPGHGISIGSLGNNNDKDHVADIHVSNCTLNGTTTGLRIKTWPRSLPGNATNITYEQIFMDNVANPIVIDQMYCPSGGCSKQSNSPIQIQDVTYKGIWGTSSSKVAMYFQCSESFPCKNVVTQDIDLFYHGPGGPANSTCNNINGKSYGKQNPRSCL